MVEAGTSRKAITVSEELLRAVLAEFKLELFTDLRNYATQIALDSLSSTINSAIEGLALRVAALEKQNTWDRGGDARGSQISAKTLAWAGIFVGLCSVIVYLVNH